MTHSHQITLIRPDDWHLHLRDNEMLASTVPATANTFARALIMPNLLPPVTDIELANSYCARIKKHIPADCHFTPLMTLYLTDETAPALIYAAKQAPNILACKLYPAHATTHSQHGVTHIQKIYPVLEAMQKMQMTLAIHGEISDENIDFFEREHYFVDRILSNIVKDFPELPIVLEHISTQHAVQFIEAASTHVAATITVHHLLCNRNQLFTHGLNPHYFCLPILKTETDRQALIKAATRGNSKFFLGTDSAPHMKYQKECCQGRAGIFSAPVALQLCTQLFEEYQALDKLEKFTSIHGAQFYRQPLNQQHITLIRQPTTIPQSYPLANDTVIPLLAGEAMAWQIQSTQPSNLT